MAGLFKELKAFLATPQPLPKGVMHGSSLISPDLTKRFVLQTDASDQGVQAVLSQLGADGHEHPVGYYSKKLLPREQHYSTIEKECLAIKLAVEAFRVYLLVRRFVIQTDHRSLEWLEKLKESDARLCRWSLSLQPYTFEAQHQAGVLNQTPMLSPEVQQQGCCRRRGKECEHPVLRACTTPSHTN